MKAFVAVFVAACHTAPPPVLVPDPVLTFLGHKLEPGVCETIIELSFSLKNTREVPLTLSHWTALVTRNGDTLPEAQTALDATIEPGTEHKLALPVHVARNCETLATNARGAPVEMAVSGKIFGEASGPVVFEFEDKAEAPPAKLPGLRAEANAQHYDDGDKIGRVAVTFALHLKNDNPFALLVDKVTYRVRIEGIDAASGETWTDEGLAADALESYEVAVRIEPADNSGLATAVRKRHFNYVLDATLSLGNHDYPIQLSGDVKF